MKTLNLIVEILSVFIGNFEGFLNWVVELSYKGEVFGV
jgi:hypothetical protein